MTPTEKRALRARERKLRQKQRRLLDKSVDKYAKKTSGLKGGVKKQKEAALESLVKSGKGVTVIGKTGQDSIRKKGKKGGRGFS